MKQTSHWVQCKMSEGRSDLLCLGLALVLAERLEEVEDCGFEAAVVSETQVPVLLLAWRGQLGQQSSPFSPRLGSARRWIIFYLLTHILLE